MALHGNNELFLTIQPSQNVFFLPQYIPLYPFLHQWRHLLTNRWEDGCSDEEGQVAEPLQKQLGDEDGNGRHQASAQPYHAVDDAGVLKAEHVRHL